MKLKKYFILALTLIFVLTSGIALAVEGGEPNNTQCQGIGNINSPCGGGGEDPGPVTGGGNFDIDTLALGGGFDISGKLIPNGAAGGINAAGGIAYGTASGEVSSLTKDIYEYRGYKKGDYNWGWSGYYYVGNNKGWFDFVGTETILLGGAEGGLDLIGGGLASDSDAYKFTPTVGDIGIGVGSQSINEAYTGGTLYVGAWGIAEAHGFMLGAAGQGSLDGSIIAGSPLPMWDSKALSYGVAGQGSLGWFVGGGVAAGLGSVEVVADIDMAGGSWSESYRAIDFDGPAKTEIIGTNVGAWTDVSTVGSVDSNILAFGYVDGGYVAGGIATAKTVQVTDSGFAKASATGTYSGSGDLGTSFSGSAIGSTQTTATQVSGYNGTVMTSSAHMSVQINNPFPQ